MTARKKTVEDMTAENPVVLEDQQHIQHIVEDQAMATSFAADVIAWANEPEVFELFYHWLCIKSQPARNAVGMAVPKRDNVRKKIRFTGQVLNVQVAAYTHAGILDAAIRHHLGGTDASTEYPDTDL